MPSENGRCKPPASAVAYPTTTSTCSICASTIPNARCRLTRSFSGSGKLRATRARVGVVAESGLPDGWIATDDSRCVPVAAAARHPPGSSSLRRQGSSGVEAMMCEGAGLTSFAVETLLCLRRNDGRGVFLVPLPRRQSAPNTGGSRHLAETKVNRHIFALTNILPAIECTG
jgi:hypothetical protein